ncbi:MAG: TonB-dependent receptor [Syntrophales bacterium]|jgi:iron complex outermembrane receptor protein
MMKRFFLLFLAAVPIFFVLQSVAAANAPTGHSTGETLQMEEVVVTATKIPEKRKDIPNAVIILDEEDIRKSGAKSIGQLLANEPGIDWRSYGNFGGAAQEIQIRGMRGNGTQVLVNGVNVNSPSLGLADVGKIPLNNIERIEVIKGSGSLLYGSGAMGGVVNIITKRPDRDKMDLKIGAGYGSQDTYRLWAEQGMFVAGNLGYYLTANRAETNGFRSNSDLRQNDVSLKMVLEQSEAIDISLYGDYLDRTYGMPGVKPPRGTADYYIGGKKFYDNEAASLLDYSEDQDGHVVLEIKGKPRHWLGYQGKGYYTHMENYNYNRYAFDGSGNKNWITNEVKGADGHVDLHPFDGATLLLGGEYRDLRWGNKTHALDSSGARSGKTATHAHLFTRGFFSEAQYRPSDYWKVFAGIRREEHSAFGSENLPFFGLIVNPWPNTALKINHGKHFLAPTPNDLYWPEDPYTKGNPDLKPETGWHSDITLEQSSLNDKIFATLSYFHWDVNDKIQWEPDSQGIFSPVNLADYKAQGVEAGIKIGPCYNLTLGLSYTWLDADEKNRAYTRQDYGWPPFSPPDFQYVMVKRRAAYTPEVLFKGDLTYQSDFGLTATATIRHVSDRLVYRTETTVYPDTRTVIYTLDSYWTMDLKAEQRFHGRYVFSLAVTNLANVDYDTHMGSFTDQNTWETSWCRYPGMGRSVFAGLSYEF